MIRIFETHKIRKSNELTNSIWEFSPCQGENKGKIYNVATPCCWQSHPDFSGYRGEGIYKKQFFASGNIRLEFKGVSHTAQVYLDGNKIVSHYNAYTAFSVIVKNLEKGNHVLEIKADNRFSKESALHIPNDYMSYGGVSRPVVLEHIDNVYVKNIQITPFKCGDLWHADVKIIVANVNEKTEIVDISANIADKECLWENVSVDGFEEIVLTKKIEYEKCQDILEWTMENPKLYMAEVKIVKNGIETDDLIDRFGFRQIEVNGRDILLNGRAVRIKGVCRHEDHPQFGCALPFSAIAADLDIIRHLGANSVRTAHYPNDEIFLDLCDELGLLVWEENHARGLSFEDMQNPNFEPQAEQVIKEMIPMHYNHPCIYIWGILNECASDSEYGKECYEKQFEIIKELDSSRPRSFASCKFKTDICFGLPEIVSYNIYPLWYHDTPADEYLDDLYQWVQNETDGAGKPFLITEIGAGGIYGYRTPYKCKWTEEYQAETLEKQINAVLEKQECSGVYIWQFCDIRVSEEWFGGRPRTMNNKGIVDEYRRRKLCYDVVKRIFESYSNYR